jgi:hypothetical protein
MPVSDNSLCIPARKVREDFDGLRDITLEYKEVLRNTGIE